MEEDRQSSAGCLGYQPLTVNWWGRSTAYETLTRGRLPWMRGPARIALGMACRTPGAGRTVSRGACGGGAHTAPVSDGYPPRRPSGR